MIVDKKRFSIPDFQICLSEKEYLKLTSRNPISKSVDLSAEQAAIVFNERRNTVSKKFKNKIPIVTTETHWFKVTHEVTRDSKASFIAKLQVFSRTYVEIAEDTDKKEDDY